MPITIATTIADALINPTDTLATYDVGNGLSKREWMTTTIANGLVQSTRPIHAAWIAELSVDIADAIISKLNE